jgi:hypothetical protein
MDCSYKTVLAVTIFSKVLHTPSMVGHFQFTAGGGGRGHSPGLSLITQKEVMHAVRLSANTVLALHVRWSLWVGTSCKVCVLGQFSVSLYSKCVIVVLFPVCTYS